MLTSMICEYEKNMMTDYIYAYSAIDDDGCRCNLTGKVNIDAALSKWAENKVELYKLFGEKLILKKEIDYQKGADQIKDNLWNYVPITSFVRNFKDCFWDLYHYETEYDWICYQITSSNILAENVIYQDMIFTHPTTQDVIKLQKGMKATKAIKKLIKWFPHLEDEYESFRICHSQVLNDRAMRGTLCLSIHPMDYMTMSDNDSRWSSCMSWRAPGGYRAGTVECMNSTNTIVAYLENESVPMDLGSSYTWNNKKWRCLFVVDPKVITSVKSYPYHNDDILDIVIEWIAGLAKENWNIEYQDKIERRESDIIPFNRDLRSLYNDRRPPHFVFETAGSMYNDFGCAHNHHHVLNKQYLEQLEKDFVREDIYIQYTEYQTCACCGKEFSPDYEGILLCENCFEPERCDSCGCVIGDNYEIGPDGAHLCHYCYDDQTTMDEVTGELIYCDEGVNLTVVGMKNEYEFFTNSLTLSNGAYFNKEPHWEPCGTWRGRYEIHYTDLTEAFLRSGDAYYMEDFLEEYQEIMEKTNVVTLNPN